MLSREDAPSMQQRLDSRPSNWPILAIESSKKISLNAVRDTNMGDMTNQMTMTMDVSTEGPVINTRTIPNLEASHQMEIVGLRTT